MKTFYKLNDHNCKKNNQKGIESMRIKELIKKLNKYNLNKDVVIYSNKKTLKNYEFLGTYENEGQVEIHIDEGINLG
tara:strand:- start:208 stop:438 length:231 start_codon:yes stop_codon:yes gene_type:complete